MKVLDVLLRYADSPFIIVNAGGNSGDILIRKGFNKLAKTYDVIFSDIKYESFMNIITPENAVVYIHGGGGYNSWWSGKPILALEKAVNTHPGVVIQGPQTYHPDEVFLRERVVNKIQNPRASKVYMFCRERYSHEIMQKVVPSWVELGLDHDTAFHLEPSDLTPHDKAGYTLYVIRRDKEASGQKAMDLTAPWLDPALDTPKFDDWLRVHARARAIVSNRLHSAIVGSILGKPTTLIANSYMKNRAVWEFSLEQRGVKWLDEVPSVSLPGRIVNSIPPLRRIFESKRGRRYIGKLRGIV